MSPQVHDPAALQILDAVLRTCDPEQTAAASGASQHLNGAAPVALLKGTLVRVLLHERERARERKNDRVRKLERETDREREREREREIGDR